MATTTNIYSFQILITEPVKPTKKPAKGAKSKKPAKAKEPEVISAQAKLVCFGDAAEACAKLRQMFPDDAGTMEIVDVTRTYTNVYEPALPDPEADAAPKSVRLYRVEYYAHALCAVHEARVLVDGDSVDAAIARFAEIVNGEFTYEVIGAALVEIKVVL